MRPVWLGLGLVAVALVISRLRNLHLEKELIVATLRAALQLAVVALVIDTVFDHLGYAGLFVLLMYGAASWTASRRIQGVRGALRIGALAVAAGALPALAVLFGLGGYPLEPRYLIPIGGIIMGGGMTAAGLAGRTVRSEVRSKVREIEARLSLGVSAAYALRSYLPSNITSALLPVLDQTKNVGLVTLPGAFVGMILGGASPVEAAQVQLTVLFSLLGAQALAAAVSASLVAHSFVAPGERIEVPAEG